MMSNMNESTLGEIITELMETRGFSIEKLTELTNINKRYIGALLSSDIKSLPAAPYVRGYLLKIAEVLDTDPEELQKAYERLEFKTSGKNDRLPGNKFLIVKSKKGIIATIIISFAILATFAIRWSILAGIPDIQLNVPAEINGFDYLEVKDPFFVIEGQTDKKDTVFINNEPIPVDYKGFFSKEVSLNDGINTLDVRVQRFLGQETAITRKIFYTAPLIIEPVETEDDVEVDEEGNVIESDSEESAETEENTENTTNTETE